MKTKERFMSKAKFTSPQGTAVWPWFSVPDTRFDAEGKYKTDLMVPKDEAAPIMAEAKKIYIEEFGEKALSKAKWPFEIDEESGGVRFRAKSSKKPVLYDAEGSVIKQDLNVGNGSEIKISGVMSTYNAGGATGVTMYLNAVQIITLEEFGSTAFDPVENGYVHTAAEEPESSETSYDF
jgi:hypothetical protein